MNISDTNMQNVHAKIMYKMAWQILKKRKFLLLLPVLGCLVLVLTTFILFYFTHLLEDYISHQLFTEIAHPQSHTIMKTIFTFLYVFIIYFIGIFILISINSTIIFCARDIINHRAFSIKQLCYTLYVRKLKIFQWSIFFGAIGLLLNFLEFISDTITELLISFISFSFYSLSWMIMPIIIEKNLSPREAINYSKELLTQGIWQDRFFLKSLYLDWTLWVGQMMFISLLVLNYNSLFPEQYKMTILIMSAMGFAMVTLLQSVLFTILKAIAYEYVTNQFFYKKIQQIEKYN